MENGVIKQYTYNADNIGTFTVKTYINGIVEGEETVNVPILSALYVYCLITPFSINYTSLNTSILPPLTLILYHTI